MSIAASSLTPGDELADTVTALLEQLGENPDREGLLETPSRVAESLRFLTEGYASNAATIVGDALFALDRYDDMVVVKDIAFYSLCEHHLLPFFGRAHIGYVPDGRVVGPPVTPLQAAQLGGAQAFLCDLATGLSQRGHEVLLYCAEGSEVPGVELVEIPVAPGAAQALVMPGSGEEPAASPAIRRAFELVFEELRSRGADVVSQHAFDAEAIQLSDGLPVLDTLHMPPISARVLGEVLRSRAAFATVSESCRRTWAAAGAGQVGVLRNGVPVFTVEAVPIGGDALLAGRLSPEKGFEDGIAAARAAGLRPVVVGGPFRPTHRGHLGGPLGPPPPTRSPVWEPV